MPLRARARLVGVLVAVLVAAAAPAWAQATGTPVFVNEIHYDNAGTDTDEAIEVAAPPGTDLTGWTLVLYNGNNGAPYDTDALPATVPDAGVVVATYPTNGIQNGSPDGVALVDAAGAVVQFLSYEGTFTAVGGPADGRTSTDIGVAEAGSEPAGQSLQLTGAGTTSEELAWTGPTTASFGARNAGQTGGGDPDPDPEPDPVTCETATTPIPQVQGAGAATPLAGQQVTVRGVVVGDFQGDAGTDGDLDGYYLQEPAGDGDAATSDGIFVYDPDATAVSEGDIVTVSGTAEDFFAQTQIGQVTGTAVCGAAPVPVPTVVDFPVAAPDALERFEGMRVAFADPLVATETRNVDNFGEIRLAAGAPLVNPTDVVEPGAAAQELAAENDLRQVLLDDGRTGSFVTPIRYVAADDTVRRGDVVEGLVGVLGYGFNAYRVQPTAEVTFTEANPRPAAPDDVGGDVQVASFNVLNYFTTLGQRGADTPEEFAVQESKIVTAINALGAEIVALQEIENNDDVALNALVAALNTGAGEQRWAAVPQPANSTETDQITVAQIYQPAAVERVGASVSYPDPAFDNAREPIAQTYVADGDAFTVVSNHFKSKGCGGASGPNADQGDGQSCFNADRVEQAEALVTFVRQLQTSTGDDDVLVLGDLNAYLQEDPVDVLDAAGLVGELEARLPEDERYTYVFDGEQGVLDHAFTTPSLSAKVTGVDVWHVNADEPDAYEYTGPFADPGSPYRASDHDPVLVGLDLVAPEAPPTVSFADVPGRLVAGRTVPVRFTVTGPDEAPLDDADLFLSVVRPDGGARSVCYDAGRRGTYRAQVPTRRGVAGTYELVVALPDGTELGRLALDVTDPGPR